MIGTGNEVNAGTVNRSTLTQADIDRYQSNNIPSLLQTLPGVSQGGSLKPGGQTINIRGFGDAEDVPLTVDGATKTGFERYQQGTVFIEPELIKRIEVEKGPNSPFTGNGGFGGTVNMITKDAPDLLQDGRNSGAMLKYGYSSNDHEQVYSGAVYGRTDDGRFDALAYLTQRDGGDMKVAAKLPNDNNEYPINPSACPTARRMWTASCSRSTRTSPMSRVSACRTRALTATAGHRFPPRATRRRPPSSTSTATATKGH